MGKSKPNRTVTPKGTPIELWWQDEARIGQKTQITRRWAKRGTRPVAPRDLRRASAWIFGAICPAEGKGAALVMPRCNSEAMDMHVAEISSQVAPGAHAVLMLDQAGWHMSGKLDIPANITLLPLPPKCPELNPVERMAVHARQLALKPDLLLLRQRRGPLLPRLEPPHRSAMGNC